jgi:tellurite resistance protein TerC
VLILIGSIMLLIDVCHIPVAWSLVATVTVLAATMVLSLYVPAKGYTGSAYPFKAKHGEDRYRAKKKN